MAAEEAVGDGEAPRGLRIPDSGDTIPNPENEYGVPGTLPIGNGPEPQCLSEPTGAVLPALGQG